MYESYQDQIIQLSGGLNDYIGKLDPAPHPLGDGWFRILEPCLTFFQDNPKLKQRQNIVAALPGPQRNFQRFVDVYIPATDPMEIKVLDKEGQIYRIYVQEISRKGANRIIIPDMGIAAGPN